MPRPGDQDHTAEMDGVQVIPGAHRGTPRTVTSSPLLRSAARAAPPASPHVTSCSIHRVSVSGRKYSWSMARDELIALAERQHVHDLDAPEGQVRTVRVSVVNCRKLKEKNG